MIVKHTIVTHIPNLTHTCCCWQVEILDVDLASVPSYEKLRAEVAQSLPNRDTDTPPTS